MKLFSLVIVIFVFCTFGATSIFAQDLSKECEAIYQSLWIDKSLTVEKYKRSLAGAKEYLEKCSQVKGQEEVRDYLIKQVPKLEKTIQEMELFNRFNNAVPAENFDESFASGKEIIAKNPNYALDVLLILARLGFDNASAKSPNDKYNDDTKNFAKMALQKMNEGKSSDSFNFFKTSGCSNEKLNATGWMNYIIGYILSVRQSQKKEALPYLYQSTQIGCETKKMSEAYRLIGDWYFDEFTNLEKSRLEKIKVAGNQETDETKSILALQKGYAERALDAYARIFKIFLTRSTENITYKADLRKKTERVYKFLFDSDLTGFDSYLKNVANTSFIDPATPVIPKSKI